MLLFVVKMRIRVEFFKTHNNKKGTWYTHGCRNVTISALAYLINYLDCQRSGRVMGGPTFFKVGDLFYKICPSHYANFRKKISSETSCGMSETLGIT